MMDDKAQRHRLKLQLLAKRLRAYFDWLTAQTKRDASAYLDKAEQSRRSEEQPGERHQGMR
jgi:hypothetical protein